MPDAGPSPPQPVKQLQLTFDDGPMNGNAVAGPLDALEAILVELRKRKVSAAFFVLGKEVKERPRGLVDILEERERGVSHVIGNHSFDHIGPPGTTDRLLSDPKKGEPVLRWQFEKTHDIVAKWIKMEHWRAPYLEGISGLERIIHSSAKLGHYLSHCDAHADSGDSQGAKTSQTMLDNLLSSKKNFGIFQPLHENRTQIRLLFHVKDATATALPKVLQELEHKGQKIVNFIQEK